MVQIPGTTDGLDGHIRRMNASFGLHGNWGKSGAVGIILAGKGYTIEMVQRMHSFPEQVHLFGATTMINGVKRQRLCFHAEFSFTYTSWTQASLP